MKLVPMAQERFQEYIDRLIVAYADDKQRAGNWPSQIALERSREEVLKLLSSGPATDGQDLFELMLPEESEPVGVLWLAVVDDAGVPKGFVYDLWIRPDLRRRGLGTMAMHEAETWARAKSLGFLSLHVFGHNPEALALYEKLGYQITNINLSKPLA